MLLEGQGILVNRAVFMVISSWSVNALATPAQQLEMYSFLSYINSPAFFTTFFFNPHVSSTLASHPIHTNSLYYCWYHIWMYESDHAFEVLVAQ